MFTGPPVPERYTKSDLYAICLACCLILPMASVGLLGIALVFPPLFVLWLYRSCALSAPLDVIPRTASFDSLTLLLFLLALPVIILLVLWQLIVLAASFFMTLPIGLWNRKRTVDNLISLRPFAGRPGRVGAANRHLADDLATSYGCLWPLSDLVRAFMGQLDRQGLPELLVGIPIMMAACPVYKYVLLGNPFTHSLRETYISQWCEALDSNDDDRTGAQGSASLQAHLKNATCRTLLEDKRRRLVDAWPFSGFHPYPPSGRISRTVAGLQFSNTFFTPAICHSTLPFDLPGHTPRSETATWTLLVVYIQWWNPCYPYTGYVELNMRRDGGLEHPMWLLNDQNSKLHMSDLHNVNTRFAKLGLIFLEYVRQQS